MKTQIKKYQTPFGRKLVTEILGWVFFISIPLGIWVNQYRWKLIFTGLFCIIIAVLLAIVDIKQEEEYGNENQN